MTLIVNLQQYQKKTYQKACSRDPVHALRDSATSCCLPVRRRWRFRGYAGWVFEVGELDLRVSRGSMSMVSVLIIDYDVVGFYICSSIGQHSEGPFFGGI